jgi:hypothetical protein
MTEADVMRQLRNFIRTAKRKEDFLEKYLSEKQNRFSSGRYQIVSFDYGFPPKDVADLAQLLCRRYHAVLKEFGVQEIGSGEFSFEIHGKACFDPEPNVAVLVDVIYSERRLPMEDSLPSFKMEGESFLQSLEFQQRKSSSSAPGG